LSEHGETIRQVDRTGRFIQGAAEDPAGAISDLALDIASDEAYSVARDNITQAAEEAVQFYVAICNDPETPEPVRLAAIAAGSMASLATEENFDTTHQVLTLGLTANDFIESGDSDRRIVNRRRRPQNNSNDIPESSYCSFVAGTKVLTPEGDRNIEEIKVGDWVIADDPHTPGGVEKRQVKHTFVHESTSLLDLYVGGEKITTDDEHEFWVKDLGWLAATDLKEGMQLQTNHETAVTVDRIQRREETQQVYNFEVEGFHTYFVSAMGILVHNACVDTRINLAKDRTRTTPIRPRSGHRDSAGFEHVVEGHFDREVTNSTSLFNISPEELKTILQSDVVVSSPVTTTDGDRFSRTVDVGRTIGTSALKYGGASASRIRVLTDRKGNLLTTYPVP
jgi:hypothetical protein